jgi:dihydroorotase
VQSVVYGKVSEDALARGPRERPEMISTRREFLHTTALVAAAAAGPGTRVPRYGVVIKGGRVVDPSQRLDRVLDVAIANGRLAALQPNIAASDAAEVIDARGKVVTAGLVDIHAHIDREMLPAHCLSTGVTSLVDAGSRGADNVGELVAIAKAAPNRVRVLLNLGRTGLGGRGELLDFANADSAAARTAIDAHRDIVIGIKARLSRNVAGARDLDAIDRAHDVTVPLKLPLMVHVGQSASPMSAILGRLRRGDIVTHVYSPPPNGILDGEGRLFPAVLEARRRGVVFDVGNGRNGHITWDVAERAIQQGFLPDTISSDLTAPGRTDRVFDFPTVLSKFLLLGMSLDRVIACATVNAARAIEAFAGLGTLRVGAPADVAVFERRTGEFEFVDNVNSKRMGREKLIPYAVLIGGKRPPTLATGESHD